MGGFGIVPGVSEALAAVAQRVREGLVLVHDGQRGAGAGIIWQPEGVIVTNHHVVAHGQPQVRLADDRDFRARVVASDPALDLAVLRVEALGLPAATIGDSRALRVGQIVLAVGNPWGQRGLVTAGIISGLGEVEVRGPRQKADYIRTDARLAPGNSGGPLVDVSGAVIGINAMILGGDRGVAIPSALADALVQETLGRRVMLGVGVQVVALSPTMQAQTSRNQARGLLVVELAPHGPAAHAGILVGDILVDLGGSALDTPRALTAGLARYGAGERAVLHLLRGGQWQTIEAELAPLERAA